jgi:uncharacterized membrane protein (UPF0127 family)
MDPTAPHRRLRRLPRLACLDRSVPVARGMRTRLLGLALISREQAGTGLLIPRCSSVHTFGMRFRLDLVFLDGAGRPLRVAASVPPFRVVSCRGATAVLEVPAEQGARIAAPNTGMGTAS